MHYPLPTYELPTLPSNATGYFRTVELEVNTSCDLQCFGCDRMSDVTTAPSMSLKQVELFVQESLELGWEWERIRILGGEPTLHPHLREIVIALIRYRDRYPNVFLQLLSNGQGKLAKYKEWLLDMGVDPHVEYKERGVQPPWFRNTRWVPVDRNPNVGICPPCGIFDRRGCGIGLTRAGYFLDGAGATIARVAGFDIGKMRLREVTLDSMMEQSKILCRCCGHWNPVGGPEVSKQVSETGQTTGPFWTRKLAEFKVKPPKMSVYGEGRV